MIWLPYASGSESAIKPGKPLKHLFLFSGNIYLCPSAVLKGITKGAISRELFINDGSYSNIGTSLSLSHIRTPTLLSQIFTSTILLVIFVHFFPCPVFFSPLIFFKSTGLGNASGNINSSHYIIFSSKKKIIL